MTCVLTSVFLITSAPTKITPAVPNIADIAARIQAAIVDDIANASRNAVTQLSKFSFLFRRFRILDSSLIFFSSSSLACPNGVVKVAEVWSCQ